MKIFFAGSDLTKYDRRKTLNDAGIHRFLYSFHSLKRYCKDVTEHCKVGKELGEEIFLDSGAFSGMTQGVHIDIRDYCDTIHQNIDRLTTYACLDVIGDYHGTQKNLEFMQSEGLEPLMTFHIGSPFSILGEMVTQTNYLAIGGLVGQPKLMVNRFLDQCFARIKTDAKVHGFGFTSLDGLKQYPFYSVDSTTWFGGSMRAELHKYHDGTMSKIKTKSKRHASGESFVFTDTGEDKLWFERNVQNAVEWMNYEQYLDELWTKRGIKWK